MSKLKLVLIQPDEFSEYYYNVMYDNDICCTLSYDKTDKQWMASNWDNEYVSNDELIYSLYKLMFDLNAATKADKLFGFL